MAGYKELEIYRNAFDLAIKNYIIYHCFCRSMNFLSKGVRLEDHQRV